MRLHEILSNPIAVIVYLPILPFIVISELFNMFSLGAMPSETMNEEIWEIYEDEETGAIKVVVHRHVRRG
jgi:hypothetical protein